MINQEQALTEMRKDILSRITELSSSLDTVKGCSIMVIQNDGAEVNTQTNAYATEPITLTRLAEGSIKTTLGIIDQLAQVDDSIKDAIDIDAFQDAIVQLKGYKTYLAVNFLMNSILSEDDDDEAK